MELELSSRCMSFGMSKQMKLAAGFQGFRFIFSVGAMAVDGVEAR